MSPIQTVAIAGASGNVGAPTTTLLHARGFTVTALTRTDSTATFPDYVTAIPVDYTSVSSLVSALHGIDAVVCCLGYFALAHQPNIVEAAAAAGVKRFIPAEYGADLLNEETRKFPILGDKLAVQEILVRGAAGGGGMSYSLVFTGLFLDWGLDVGMIVNVKEAKGRLYDLGDRVASFTTTGTIAKAIVGCLEHLEETKNRGVYVQDVATSQNHIVELAKEVRPQVEWQLESVDTAVLEKEAHEAFLKKDYANMAGSVFRMYFGGEQYGQPFAKLDNELFGITQMTDQDLKQLITTILKL